MRIVDEHLDLIVANLKKGSDVVSDGRIAVRTESDLLTVDFQRPTLVDTLKHQGVSLVGQIGSRKMEHLRIMSLASREIRTVVTGGCVAIEGQFDTPIVREIYGFRHRFELRGGIWCERE